MRKAITSQFTVTTVEKGDPGASGADAFIIDIDNDNDSFGTDSDSKVVAQQVRETHVRMYLGTAEQAVTALSAALYSSDDDSAISSGVATVACSYSGTVGTVTVTIKADARMNASGMYALITASCAKKSGNAIRFTLQKVKSGEKGVSPEIYQLYPTECSFPFGRDAGNNLTPSAGRSTTIKVKKTVGNTTTIETAVTGYTYRYGFDSDAATATGQAINTAITVTTTQAAAHSSVWIELMKGTTVVDRETLPILKDGQKGPAGTQTETKYKSNNSATTPPAYSTDAEIATWSTTPTAIDATNRYRWKIVRTRASDSAAWGSWSASLDAYLSKDAVTHELVPSPASVNFRSNAAGEYLPSSYSVTCRIMRAVGDAAPVSVESPSDGLYSYFRRNTDSQWYPWNPQTGSVSVTKAAATAENSPLTDIRFCLSTASAYSNVANSNIVADVTVMVVCDGRIGKTGATGRFFYTMGEWNADTLYQKTSELVPMVHLDDGVYNANIGAFGHYWYLKADSAQGSAQKPQNNSEYWTRCDDFGVVITQGLFAEFAKLGKAIMSGDYMFSMNGHIGSTDYESGALFKGSPAYILFAGDPSERTYDLNNLSVNIGTADTTISTDSYLTLKSGETAVLRVTVSSSVTFCIAKKNLTAHQTFDVSTSSASVWYSGYTEYNMQSGTVYFIRFTAPAAGDYRLRASRSTAGTVTFNISRQLFDPNWWVDLRTGKMVAARGNFIVKPNGDVDVSGTIRARNLFRGVCILTGYYNEVSYRTVVFWSTKWYYCKSRNDDRTIDGGFEIGKYYNDGDYSGMLATNSDFVQCTYDADMVLLKDNGAAWWPAAGTVVLPRAQDFPGKTVEILHNTTGGTNPATVKQVDDAIVFADFSYSDQGVENIYGNASVDSLVAAKSTAVYYSYLFNGTYYWRRIG